MIRGLVHPFGATFKTNVANHIIVKANDCAERSGDKYYTGDEFSLSTHDDII